MKTLNIFIENIYSGPELDELELLNNLKKITHYFLEQKEVVDSSCLKAYEYETLCFDVVLCDNGKIREINRDYRGKDQATDVISFAIFADSTPEERFILDAEINLGEIIVSVDKIQEQALEHGLSFKDELYFLLAHGLLHCLGFDHKTDADYKTMVELQNKAKATLNV